MVLSSSIYLAFFHARYTPSDDRHRHHLLVKFEDASDLAPDAMDAMETQKITRRFVSDFHGGYSKLGFDHIIEAV